MFWRCFFLALAFLPLVTTPARAADKAVEDCNQGADRDRQIAGCTKFLARGMAESQKNRAAAYCRRASAYDSKNDYDRVIKDYDEAIRLDPKIAWAYHDRSLVHLYSGNSDKALADMSQASDLDPKNAYNALWLDIIGQRNNVASRLSQSISSIDMTTWPAPVVRMFLGQLTPAAALTAADNPEDTKKKGQICEANFYAGELALRTGAQKEAVRLFGLAASDCPKSFTEWSAANAELKALGIALR